MQETSGDEGSILGAFSEFSARKLISMTKYYGFLGKERFSVIVFLRKSNHYFSLLKNTEEFTTFY